MRYKQVLEEALRKNLEEIGDVQMVLESVYADLSEVPDLNVSLSELTDALEGLASVRNNIEKLILDLGVGDND